jgi:hypothetical protein
MDADDASFADMRRPLTDPDPDPLALDEETVERLLTGDLPPSQVPPGYAQVGALLAATTAEPTHEELAGQSEVLAELRAVTRPRRAGAHTRRVARPTGRRWAGLAAVALVGALVTGGVAVAATGNLPAPVRNVARSILGGAGGDLGQATPTRSDPQAAPDASSPASAVTAAGPKGPLPTGSTVPGSGPKGAGPVAEPDRERLCKEPTWPARTRTTERRWMRPRSSGWPRRPVARAGSLPTATARSQVTPSQETRSSSRPEGRNKVRVGPRPATVAARGRASRRAHSRPTVEQVGADIGRAGAASAVTPVAPSFSAPSSDTHETWCSPRR